MNATEKKKNHFFKNKIYKKKYKKKNVEYGKLFVFVGNRVDISLYNLIFHYNTKSFFFFLCGILS